MAKAAVLNVEVLTDVKKALDGFEQVKAKSTGTFDLMKNAVAGAETAVAGFLTKATMTAMDHQKEVAKVGQAYANLGLPMGDVNEAMDKIDESARRTGLSADDSVDAYARLVSATHDSGKAMDELATAQDLAAFKGVSVTDAAKALTSAQQGNTRALKEMGIATKDQYGHALSATEVMEKLTQAVHGQADAYGKTAAGQMARFHESLDQIQVTIGNALLPALQGFLNVLQPLFEWLSKHTEVTRVLVPIIVGLGGAVVGITVGVKAWTTAQAALNIVMDANPIMLVVVAAAALVVGIVEAYNHVKWFRDAVDAVWSALKAVGEWIMGHWKLIIDVMLGPVGILLTNLDKVISVLKTVIGWLERVGEAASKAFGWIGKVASVGGGILSKIPGLHALPGGPEAAPVGMATVVQLAIYVAPGDQFPEAVYRGLKEYQRRHVRPELRALFNP